MNPPSAFRFLSPSKQMQQFATCHSCVGKNRNMGDDATWQHAAMAFGRTFVDRPGWRAINRFDATSDEASDRWRSWRSPLLEDANLARLYYKGLGNRGDPSRLQRLAAKLLNGENVTM